MSDIIELTIFDKINLAFCAMQRAKEASLDNERFNGEYSTVQLWKAHRVVQTRFNGKDPWGYVSNA